MGEGEGGGGGSGCRPVTPLPHYPASVINPHYKDVSTREKFYLFLFLNNFVLIYIFSNLLSY